MTKIAIDAMGGDNAPDEIVKGVAQASHEFDAEYILIGDRIRLEHCVQKYPPRSGTFEIRHTAEFVGMDESPRDALESKPEASISVAAKLLKEDKADAMLSAGNTGAVILAVANNIPMIEGVERSALAVVLPNLVIDKSKPAFTLLLDVGATIHCDVKHLVHFAIMGNIYSKEILGLTTPRLGLLNIGAEDTKGGYTLTQTHKVLKDINELDFIGNIEGNGIIAGEANVVVCDGILGNVLIKLLEGVAEALGELGRYAYNKNIVYKMSLAMLSPGIKKLKKTFDYAEYGGASLMGFRKLCVKAHGKSNAKAIKNAIRVAVMSAQSNMCDKISQSVAEINRKIPFSEFVK